MAINPEPADKSISMESDPAEGTGDEDSTKHGEETQKECYHHITSIETKKENTKRTAVNNEDFEDDNIPFTRADSANLFRSQPYRIQESIIAGGLILHHEIVTI